MSNIDNAKITWRGLEPWIQAKVKGAVLGYRAQVRFLRDLQDAAISPARPSAEVFGGRGNTPGDPTFAAVMRLDRLRSREILALADVAAVDAALHEILKDIDSDSVRRRLTGALLDSFDGRVRGVAFRDGLCMSERTFWRKWRRFALLIAENLFLLA